MGFEMVEPDGATVGAGEVVTRKDHEPGALPTAAFSLGAPGGRWLWAEGGDVAAQVGELTDEVALVVGFGPGA